MNHLANRIVKSKFGTLPDGRPVDNYLLSNKEGMSVEVLSYGGIIKSCTVADSKGNFKNVVLGFDSLSGYLSENPYFGAIVGRYCNRIAKGRFKLDGIEYVLAQNNGLNHLHGGISGFNKALWQVETKEQPGSASVVISHLSRDGDEGYPGDLSVTVEYTLDDANRLSVRYQAKTNKKTVVNLTQHSYFNLSGDFTRDILDHKLTIYTDQFLPVNEELIPTGEIKPVANGPFDFRMCKAIGRDIRTDDVQLQRGKGYDHCWVLNNDGKMKKAAKVIHSESGRVLTIDTNEPGIQLYTGNSLDGTLPIPGGGLYGAWSGFCLETQHYPDSPNHDNFPSVVLEPGECYKSTTVFSFTTL